MTKEKVLLDIEKLKEKLSDKQNELEKIETKEMENKNKKYIGRYFKIKREFMKDRWTEYYKVIGVEGVHYITIMFYEWLGRIEIQRKYLIEFLNKTQEIKKAEYEKEFKRMLDVVLK